MIVGLFWIAVTAAMLAVTVASRALPERERLSLLSGLGIIDLDMRKYDEQQAMWARVSPEDRAAASRHKCGGHCGWGCHCRDFYGDPRYEK